jgi:NAD(P)-dependent dehydrogenase (short-subunit alcohol dehydrogenase family)
VPDGPIQSSFHQPLKSIKEVYNGHRTESRGRPVGRIGEVSDVVDAILYLESAGFVTGEILHVDGGQSAGR